MLGFLLLAACVPDLTSGAAAEPWVAPDNDWPMGEPPADLVAEGYAEGEVPPDVRGIDQHGQEVSLWQFYGFLVVVDLSTMWCGPCQEIAAGVEETWQEYRDEGVIYLTLLSQDADGYVPDQADLQAWADGFGITAPVVADGQGWTDGVLGGSNAFPRLLLLGRDLRILDVEIQPPSDSGVRDALDEALAAEGG